MVKPENIISQVAKATDAATRLLSLQSELFLLNQERKATQQIKKAMWICSSLIFFTILIVFTTFWVEVGLHENGWPAWSLGLTSFVWFGLLTALCVFCAFRRPKELSHEHK